MNDRYIYLKLFYYCFWGRAQVGEISKNNIDKLRQQFCEKGCRMRFTTAKWLSLFVVMLGLAGCEGDSGLKAVEKEWEDYCSRVDCTQFPDWHYTFVLNGEYYYFPMDRTNPRRINLTFRSAREVKKIDGEIVLVRMANMGQKWLNGYKCCRMVMKRLGLLKEWPENIYPGSSFRFYPDPEYSDIGGGARNYHSLAEAKGDNFQSLGEDFWLIEFGEIFKPTAQTIGRPVKFVSKKPMLFGRHVLIDCTTLCTIVTLKFDDERGKYLPLLRTDGVIFSDYDPIECEDKNPLINCDKGFVEVLSALPKVFEIIEEFIVRLKQKPDNVTGELK